MATDVRIEDDFVSVQGSLKVNEIRPLTIDEVNFPQPVKVDQIRPRTQKSILFISQGLKLLRAGQFDQSLGTALTHSADDKLVINEGGGYKGGVHMEVKAPDVGPSPGNRTSTEIHVCNLNAEPVKVTINFSNADGSLQSKANATKVDNLVPFGSTTFGPALAGHGLLELIATAPIYPSGFIVTDARPQTFTSNPDAQMETVAYAMTFYALPDK